MARTVTYTLVALLAVFAAYVVPPVRHELKVLGLGRGTVETTIPNPKDYIKIDDTIHCEDVHHYTPANVLFAACEDHHMRFQWFPPLGSFDPPPEGTQGSFRVIDPETMSSTRLSFENFDKTFVTHGIDVIEDPGTKDAVYIFAVNHQPNPEWVQTRKDKLPKSNSQIELFHHFIGSKTVRHIRTIRHPLIKTPNDIHATSPSSFYVTNDHGCREGIGRTFETIIPVGWSSTIHVTITDLSSTSPEEGLEFTTALTGIKNNNGLGRVTVRGEETNEIMICDAERGIFYLAQATENKTLSIKDTIPMDSNLDNPSYYSDPYATPDDDASSYVLAGLARGLDLAGHAKDPKAIDPTYVWLVRRSGARKGARETAADATQQWEKKLVFADDGSRLRTASAAVIVAIDPKTEGGKKRGWLFVTGFMSESMIATKIDL